MKEVGEGVEKNALIITNYALFRILISTKEFKCPCICTKLLVGFREIWRTLI